MPTRPTLEHRHYVAFAAMLNHALSSARDNGAINDSAQQYIVFKAADWLTHTNASFSRQRFIAAAMGAPKGSDR